MEMLNNNLVCNDVSSLNRLAEYCRYLYEIENERDKRLVGSVKLYLAFIIVTFSAVIGVVELIGNEKILSVMVSPKSATDLVVVLIFYLSILLLMCSFVFTILTQRIKSYERLSESKKFVTKASDMAKEEDLISAIIANYAVATDRNFQVNQKKAKLLSYSLTIYFVGIGFFLCSLIGVEFFIM